MKLKKIGYLIPLILVVLTSINGIPIIHASVLELCYFE